MDELMDELRYLPAEIIVIIFSRLPVKTLLKLKAVCKSWKTLIDSPSFIHTHLLHNSGSRVIGQTTNESTNYSLFRFRDDKFLMDGSPEPPSPDPKAIILCSCDGVLLLQSYSMRSLILWNPSTRKVHNLHSPFIVDYGSVNYGLCHDRVTGDLKIVIISWNAYVVYSCNNKSWTEPREILVCGDVYTSFAGAVCVGGASYWTTFVGKLASYVGDIVCYDSESDVLKTLQKPKDLKPVNVPCLISLRDRLCVWFCNVDAAVVRIWMKEEEGDGWMEFMKIENVPRPYYWRRPLYMDEDGIIVDLWNRRVMRYRVCDKTYKEIEYSWGFSITHREYKHEWTYRQRMFYCMDSLVCFSVKNQLGSPKR